MFNENYAQTDTLSSPETLKAVKHNQLSRMLSKLSNAQQKPTGDVTLPSTTMDRGDFCKGLRKDFNLLSKWARFIRSIRIKRLATIKCQIVSETFRYTFRISLALTLRALSIKGVSDNIVHRTRSSLYRTADRMTQPYVVREYHRVKPAGVPPKAQATGGPDKKRSIFAKKPKSPLFASKSKKKSKIRRNSDDRP